MTILRIIALVAALWGSCLTGTNAQVTSQQPMGGTIAASSELHTPERGSLERKAIMDALRAPVEKKLRQSVIFKIDELKVQSGWAFLIGKPQRPDGTAIDYKDTSFRDAIDAGAFDDSIIGLLHEVNGKWRVVQYVIGATDVPYVDWDKKYRAPRAIFEMH